MQTTAFWEIETRRLVEVDNVSEVLAASIIRAEGWMQ
jgi:hypothetical protein